MRGGVAVAGDAEVDQLPVGEVGAGEDARHAAVDGVEAVRVAEEVVGGLGAAADAGELGDAVRLDVELPEGLDQRGADRVVAAAGAQGADLALVVAARVADLVLRQGRVVELGLGDVGHVAFQLSEDAVEQPNWAPRAARSSPSAQTAVCTTTSLRVGVDEDGLAVQAEERRSEARSRCDEPGLVAVAVVAAWRCRPRGAWRAAVVAAFTQSAGMICLPSSAP